MVRQATGIAMTVFRPHDLLWLRDPAALVTTAPLPAWATLQWLTVAPVVVRREAVADTTLVPVGLRGTTRSQRCAAYVPASGVRRIVIPEQIARGKAWRNHPDLERLPALRALAHVAPLLDFTRLAWGVTGGAGFALATGLEVLRPDSDLDLLIRAPAPLDGKTVAGVAASLPDGSARIDIQVETRLGAFSLKEWQRTGGFVLLKTAFGPVLTANPWAAVEGA